MFTTARTLKRARSPGSHAPVLNRPGMGALGGRPIQQLGSLQHADSSAGFAAGRAAPQRLPLRAARLTRRKARAVRARAA